MPDLRVLVVSPSALARGGMEELLRRIPGVTAVASSGVEEAAALAAQLLADVALLDVGAGEPEDLEAIARLAIGPAGLPVVALGGSGQSTAHALALGAGALLPAEVDPPTLQAALQAASRQLVVIPRGELSAILPDDDPVDDAAAVKETLTPRELEVLQGMARGLTNRQIAVRLKISEHTVKFHAASVLGKLDARSRTEAVTRGIRAGVILV
ncbi:MAG TPA: response regulator transcription factor [Candidatus Limnocylindrales bacterium]|nr:response regulator transcription factor [Candidatus Limnocylindrales bacterium]